MIERVLHSFRFLMPAANVCMIYHAKFSCASPFVTVEGCHHKALITLNRPKALNALNLEMMKVIHDQLKNCENKKYLVIMKGMGDKSFSAGADVRMVYKNGACKKSYDFFREEYTVNYLISNYKIPYISLIDGIIMGGGVGLAIYGKYRIATERTLFAMPETAIGFFPDVGASYFLSRMHGKLGLYLGLTGSRLKGSDVLKAGIATHYCDSKELCHLEAALLKCADPKQIPIIINKLTTVPSKGFSLCPYMGTINKCFDAPCVEKIFENLKQDGSEWALKTLGSLKEMSPLSLKVVRCQVKQGEKLSLAECLKMEFRMLIRCLERGDFMEGVRALLVEKDKNPKWNPPSIECVSDEQVAAFFEKLPDAEELKLSSC